MLSMCSRWQDGPHIKAVSKSGSGIVTCKLGPAELAEAAACIHIEA